MDTREHPFSRLELLTGPAGLAKLRSARVAVIGLGGVGSYAVEALARAGVGRLILVDHDTICLTNINRQLHALIETLGRPKVDVMVERIKLINPEAALAAKREFATAENLSAVLHEPMDYVVDAIDTVASKAALIQYCVENSIPVVSVMGTGNKFDPLAFRIDDISRTHTCPLAKAVRKMLREKGIESGVKVVYSVEKPAGRPVETDDTKEEGSATRRQIPGSTSYVPPIAGLIAAGVVIRDLLQTNV